MNYLVVKCKSTTNLSRRKRKSFYGNTQTIDTFESQRNYQLPTENLIRNRKSLHVNALTQHKKKSFQINLNHTNSTQ